MRPDLELLRLAADGDVAAFRALYDRHQRAVHRLAFAIVLDRDDANDVVQETFVRLHRHASKWATTDHLVGWLQRVTVNSALSARRRAMRVFSTMLKPNRQPSAQRSLEVQQSLQFFREATASLAPRQRAVVALAIEQDLTPSEIAPLVGLTPNAARVTLHHGLSRLREAAASAGIELPADEPVFEEQS